MVVEHPLRGTVYYEFKSVKSLSPKDFVSQFSRDLSRDNFSVENLRWIFDPKKATRQDLEKLRRDIEKALSEKSPTMPKKEKELLVERILDEVFVVN